MKHTLAHAMRRTARMLIVKSNKLDPPARSVWPAYTGQLDGIGWRDRILTGLADTTPSLPNRGR